MNGKRTKGELKALHTLRNLRQIRKFLGLSQSEMTIHIPNSWSTRDHISKSWVSMIENGAKQIKRQFQFDAIARAIATRLTNRYGREIGVRILAHSPWKVTAHYWCAKCHQYHELKTARQTCRRGKAK